MLAILRYQAQMEIIVGGQQLPPAYGRIRKARRALAGDLLDNNGENQ